MNKEILQQIANSQVRAVMEQKRQQEIAQLQKDFDAWNKQQNEIAQLEADYNAWLEQQKAQEAAAAQAEQQMAQPQPSIEQPLQVQAEQPRVQQRTQQKAQEIPSLKQQERDLSEWFKPKTASGIDINKKAAKDRFVRERQEYLANLKGEDTKGNIPVLRDTSNKASSNNALVGGSIEQLPGLDDYLNQIPGGNTSELKKEIEDKEKAKKWLSTDYKMTPEEVKEAQEIARKGLSKYENEKTQVTPDNDIEQRIANLDAYTDDFNRNKPTSEQRQQEQDLLDNVSGYVSMKRFNDMTAEEQEDYLLYKNLMDKTRPLNAYGRGVAKIPFKISEVLANAGLDVAETLGDMGAGALDDLTGNHDTYKYQSKVRDYFDNKRAQVEENIKDLNTARQNAEIQNPGAYGAGEGTTQVGLYALTNGIFDKLAAGAGATTAAGKFAANQVGQNAQDLALDTIPMLNELKEDGELTKDDYWKLGKNIAGNAGLNMLIPGLQVGTKAAEKTAYNELAKTVGGNADILKNIDYNGALRNVPDALREAAQVTDTAKAAGEVVPSQVVKNAENAEALAKQGVSAEADGFIPSSYQKGNGVELPTQKAINNLSNTPKNVVNTGSNFRQFVEDAVKSKGDYKRFYYGTVSDELANDIKKSLGIDTKGMDIVYDTNHIQHIMNEHGDDAAEALRGQVGVTVDSLADSPRIFDNPDEIKWLDGTNSDGNKVFSMTKRVDDTYYVATGYKDAKNQLMIDSFRIKKNPLKADYAADAAQSLRPDSSSKSGSNLNLTDAVNDVNKNSINNPETNKVMAEDIGLEKPKEVPQETPTSFKLTGDIEPVKEPQTTTDLWDELKAGEQGGAPSTPKAAQKVNEQGQKLSKLHSTLQNTETLTPEQKQAYADKNGFWYDPDNERALAEQAKAAVENDLDGIYKHYAGEKLDPGQLTGADAHKMFTASYDYSKMAQEALKEGDTAAANLYTQKARNLMLNAREAATKGGQFNAAIAYYAKTPQGYIDKAYGLLEKQITDFKAKNPKLSNGIDELSESLSDILKDTDVEAILTGSDEAAKDSLRRMVLDGMSEMIDKSKNKYLKDTFKNLSTADIDEIIQSKYAQDIARQLDMFSMGAFGVKPETVDKVMDLFAQAESYGFNSKQYYKLEQEAFNLLANDLSDGKSFADKLSAWRYFSMLSSPQTHIRNNLGNLTNAGLTGVKNNIAATIEAAAERVAKWRGYEGIEGGRTRSILNPMSSSDNDLIKAAGTDFDDNAFRQYKQAGNKWLNANQELDKAGRVFKNNLGGKILNTLTEGNSNLLDYEDIIAGKAKYRTSLAGFLKANGADASIFKATDDASKQLLEQGRQVALNAANEATFHQSNKFAELFSKGIRSAKDSDHMAVKALGYVGDTILPFVKTPSNILAQSFAYSPLEFIKVAAETNKWKKGVISSADYINDIAKGITGTMGLALGAILEHEGILYVGTGDKDLDNYNAKRGIKPMSIKVGKDYVSLSELAPAAMSIIAGADTEYYLKKAMKGESDMALDALTSGVYSTLESINDMTMLNGVADTLSSIRYADTDTDVFGSLARNVAGNFASQLIPTLGGKVEKTIDDTKRTTYTDKKGKAAKYWDQESKYYQTKIPGLQEAGEALKQSQIPSLQAAGNRLALEPSVGTWGEELKQQDYGLGTGGRILNNFLNPLTTTTDTSDRVDNELRALYEETGDNKVLNYGLTASSNQTVDGEKLSPKDWTAFQKGYGNLKHELAEKLMDTKEYDSLSGADKVEIYSKMESFAKAYTQNKVTGKEMSKANQALAESYDKGGIDEVVNTLTGKGIAKSAGVKSNSVAGKAATAAAEKGNLEEAAKIIEESKTLSDYGLSGAGPQATYQKAQQLIPSLTTESFANTYKAIDTDGNLGIKQDEIIDYLNKTHASQAEGQKIWNAYGNSNWKKIPSLADGTWSKKQK